MKPEMTILHAVRGAVVGAALCTAVATHMCIAKEHAAAPPAGWIETTCLFGQPGICYQLPDAPRETPR